MSKEEKLRSEIEDKYKWDLSTIYKTDELWEEDYNKYMEVLNKYKDIRMVRWTSN